MSLDPEAMLEALLKKVEAGALPEKPADVIRFIKKRLDAGKPISEIQAQLMEDLGHEHGMW
jgi:hypothetical protein